jgi:hypothetical protein
VTPSRQVGRVLGALVHDDAAIAMTDVSPGKRHDTSAVAPLLPAAPFPSMQMRGD